MPKLKIQSVPLTAKDRELFVHYQFETIRWFGNCKDYEIAVKAP
jgi:hypothetical protein